MAKANVKQKIADLRIPPLIIILSMLIIISIAVLTTLVAQEYVEKAELMKQMENLNANRTNSTDLPKNKALEDMNTTTKGSNITKDTDVNITADAKSMESEQSNSSVSSFTALQDGDGSKERTRQHKLPQDTT